MATYYVDWEDGSDSNDGSSPSQAWLTSGKVFGASGLTTSTTNTVYFKPGTYWGYVDAAFTNPTAKQTFIADANREVAWTTPPPVGITHATITNRASSWSSLAQNFPAWRCTTRKDNLVFRFFRFVAGGSTSSTGAFHATCSGSGSDTMSNLEFYDCGFEFYHGAGTTGAGINLTGGSYPGLKIDRCWVESVTTGIRICVNASETGIDLQGSVQNTFVAAAGSLNNYAGVLFEKVGSGTTSDGGIDVHQCTVMVSSGIRGIRAIDAFNVTYPFRVTDCLILAPGANALAGQPAAAVLTSNYNVIAAYTAYSNVTGGAQDQTNWHPYLNIGLLPTDVFHPFVPRRDSPAIGYAGSAGASSDYHERPRPGSGNSGYSVGAFERPNIATKASGKTTMLGPSVTDLFLPVDDVETTVTVEAFRDTSSYTLGTRPSLSVLRGLGCGVSDNTDTATASADDAWEELSLTFTPTSTGYVVIRLRNASASSSGACYFRTLRW